MNDTTAKILETYQHTSWAKAIAGVDRCDEWHTILEKHFNRETLGAYHVHPKIIYSLTERTICQFILTQLQKNQTIQTTQMIDSGNLEDLLSCINQDTAQHIVNAILPNMRILDPAVGSGAFLVAAWKVVFSIYQFIYKKGFLDGRDIPFDLDAVKLHIITHNLYGMDIAKDAIAITKLRLSLHLLPAPLPVVMEATAMNLVVGNSLVDSIEGKDNYPSFDIILTHPPKDKASHAFIKPWYKKSVNYHHQTSPKINPPALFLERCFQWLRIGGQCGMLLPSGIYTDLGNKGVRDLLFEHTQIQGLFCFENRKAVCEGADSRFRLVALNFTKGGETRHFPACFMRHDIEDFFRFPKDGSLELRTDFIRRLSPDSHSIMEFKNELDIQIAEKMLQFPLLGEKIEGVWNLELVRELNITNHHYRLTTEPADGRFPLYEGRMIGQFHATNAAVRFWVTQSDVSDYRFAMRKSSSNTNERTLVATVLPKNVVGADSLYLAVGHSISVPEQVYLVAIANSFMMDAFLRNKIANQINRYIVFQLPIPRLIATDPRFMPIAQRAARLICTTPEFDTLAQMMGLQGHQDGITDPIRRTRMRAELDGLIAHLYGLSEEELVHILESFPLVDETAKIATLNAYWRAQSRE